jgi:2,3-bisphosphoglycerate-dependent phosphoglycerate mutase
MQLYFIRHAQSANNALWDQIGSGIGRNSDPPVTIKGQQQANHLADYLKSAQQGFSSDGKDLQNTSGIGLTHLYTSLMLRAVQTSAVIAEKLEMPLISWVDLHEGGGIYIDDEKTGEAIGLSGNGRSFFEEHFPTLILPDWLDETGWWNRPFEERTERRARARRFLAELTLRHGQSQDRVAVISHGGFFNHIMAVLLKLPEVNRFASPQAVAELNQDNVILTAEREIWFSLNNASITRLDFVEEEIKLAYMNRVDFLPKDLIT